MSVMYQMPSMRRFWLKSGPLMERMGQQMPAIMAGGDFVIEVSQRIQNQRGTPVRKEVVQRARRAGRSGQTRSQANLKPDNARSAGKESSNPTKQPARNRHVLPAPNRRTLAKCLKALNLCLFPLSLYHVARAETLCYMLPDFDARVPARAV